MQKKLRELRRDKVRVEGDGNCLLHAVAMQMNDPDVDHIHLRQLIYNQAEKNAKYYSVFSRVDYLSF